MRSGVAPVRLHGKPEISTGTLFIYLIGDYMNSPIKLPPLPPLPPETIVDESADGGAIYGQDNDELKAWATAYAEQAVRDALDHAFNELNVLFMETLKARIPGDDLDDNDEKFNIGMCAQALGISRCQHVLRGLNTHSENNHE